MCRFHARFMAESKGPDQKGFVPPGNSASPNEKVKFTVSVRGHQWSSARHLQETIEEFATVIQRNARRLDFISESDRIQRLQLARADGSEPEDLDVDATLEDVIICMGNKHLVAIITPGNNCDNNNNNNNTQIHSSNVTNNCSSGSPRTNEAEYKSLGPPSPPIVQPCQQKLKLVKIDNLGSSYNNNESLVAAVATPTSACPASSVQEDHSSDLPQSTSSLAGIKSSTVSSLFKRRAASCEPPIRGLKITIPSSDPAPPPPGGNRSSTAGVFNHCSDPELRGRLLAAHDEFDQGSEQLQQHQGVNPTFSFLVPPPPHHHHHYHAGLLGPNHSKPYNTTCFGDGLVLRKSFGRPVALMSTKQGSTPSPAELAHLLVKGSSLPPPPRPLRPPLGNVAAHASNASMYSHCFGNGAPIPGFESFASALVSRLPAVPPSTMVCGPPNDNIALLAQFLASQLRAFVPVSNGTAATPGAAAATTQPPPPDSSSGGPHSPFPINNKVQESSTVVNNKNQNQQAEAAAAPLQAAAVLSSRCNKPRSTVETYCCHLQSRDHQHHGHHQHKPLDSYASSCLQRNCLRQPHNGFSDHGCSNLCFPSSTTKVVVSSTRNNVNNKGTVSSRIAKVALASILNGGSSQDKDDTSSSANMYIPATTAAAAAAASAAVSNDGIKGDNNSMHGRSELIFLVNRRSKTGIGAHHLKLSDLSVFFHLSVVDAAKKLGVSQTTLKKACRKFGLKRWPGRKVRSLESTIHGLEHTIAVGQGAGMEQLTEAYMRSEVTKLQQEMDQLVHGTLAQQHSPVARTADLYKRLYSRGWRSKYHSPCSRFDLDLNMDNRDHHHHHHHHHHHQNGTEMSLSFPVSAAAAGKKLSCINNHGLQHQHEAKFPVPNNPAGSKIDQNGCAAAAAGAPLDNEHGSNVTTNQSSDDCCKVGYSPLGQVVENRVKDDHGNENTSVNSIEDIDAEPEPEPEPPSTIAPNCGETLDGSSSPPGSPDRSPPADIVDVDVPIDCPDNREKGQESDDTKLIEVVEQLSMKDEDLLEEIQERGPKRPKLDQLEVN